jgi:hypothetical protein
MKDAMTKLKQQAADLAARAAAEAEEASKFRAQAEAEYNDVAAQLEEQRQQVRQCCVSASMLATSIFVRTEDRQQVASKLMRNSAPCCITASSAIRDHAAVLRLLAIVSSCITTCIVSPAGHKAAVAVRGRPV